MLPPSRVPSGGPGPPSGSARSIPHASLAASRSSEAVSSGEHTPASHPLAHKPLSLNWHRTLHGLAMSHRPSNAHEGATSAADPSVAPPHSHQLAPPNVQMQQQPLLTQVMTFNCISKIHRMRNKSVGNYVIYTLVMTACIKHYHMRKQGQSMMGSLCSTTEILFNDS